MLARHLEGVSENFDGSARLAEDYMKLARRREQIEEAKTQRAAFLSIREALRVIERPRMIGGPDPLPPAEEIARAAARRRAKARKERKLTERFEEAIRTGALEAPADLDISPGTWDQMLYKYVVERQRNLPNVVDALTAELDNLMRYAPPEELAGYLAVPEENAELYEELRRGVAWITRVLEEADPDSLRLGE